MVDTARGAGSDILDVLPGLTLKQHEVLRFVAQNRTSKEIAWELGISESAVNQRIEGVRLRTGSPPRAELARAYRQYQQDLEAAGDPLPEEDPSVALRPNFDLTYPRDELAGSFSFADAMPYRATASRQREEFGKSLPEVLDENNARLSRNAVLMAIAAGVLVAVVGLELVRVLTDLI